MNRVLDMANPINWLCPLNRGVIGWWMAPDGWQSGSRLPDLCNMNHGTLTSMTSVTDWRASEYGPDLSFGSARYVGTRFARTLGDWTCATIFMPPAAGSATYDTVIDKKYDTGFGLQNNGGTSWCVFSFASFGAVNISLANGAWHSWVACREGGTLNSWGNGGDVSATGAVASTALDSTTLSIGGRVSAGAGSNPFTGRVQLVLMLDRAVSRDWASNFHDQWKCGFPDMLNWVDFPSLYAPVAVGGVGGSLMRSKLLTNGLLIGGRLAT